MKTTTAIVLSIAILSFFVPESAAGGSCSTGTVAYGAASCSVYYSCSTGSRLTVTVSGINAAGTASGCGVSASCTTGLTGTSCTGYSGTVGAGWSNDVLYCSVAGIGAAANCNSS
jgi:hypothetical protein